MPPSTKVVETTYDAAGLYSQVDNAGHSDRKVNADRVVAARYLMKGIDVKHPRIVRFYLSALQEPDSVNRARVERSVDLDRAARDCKLAALDAERLRNAPVAMAYFLAVATIVVPVAAAVWWLVTR